MTQLQKIHLIFKTHLDVGFTDYARNVVAQYFQRDIPQAIELAAQLRRAGGKERFVWTTGSWLIYEYLEEATAEQRRRMEDAIAAGDITWHGLPFTTHSELMDADLFRFGLSLSRELDQRFGRTTIAAKMTDVPGHTRGIVPLLAEAGIRFLHIGVNPGSKPPDVPPVFVWSSSNESDVIVMYHKGSYGDLMTIDGMDEAIAFAHTEDNVGPQSPQQVIDIFARMQARFPGAQITASTMDAFAVKLEAVKSTLPVVTGEIGDTWIHGGGTDPLKVSRYRELLRLRRHWTTTGKLLPGSEPYRRFHRSLLMVPEHTWGMDLKKHLLDYDAYNREDFDAARAQDNFKNFEASWSEQRAYVDAAVAALPSILAEQARQQLASLTPEAPRLAEYHPVDIRGRFKSANFEIGFDPASGAVNHLHLLGTRRQLASPNHLLGAFSYQTFSAADYERFYLQYNINHAKNWIWVLPDFTKPGLEESSAESRTYTPEHVSLYHRADSNGSSYLVEYHMPEEASRRFGCPRKAFLEVSLPDNEPCVDFQLLWFEKPANRMPEALWLSFNPRTRTPRMWKMDKLGQLISPLEVIRDGNRKQHGVQSGLHYDDGRSSMSLLTLDAPLVSPGDRSLLDFNNRQPNLARGFHFCLYNNIWGTNFPMWYDDDGLFRFRLLTGSPDHSQPERQG